MDSQVQLVADEESDEEEEWRQVRKDLECMSAISESDICCFCNPIQLKCDSEAGDVEMESQQLGADRDGNEKKGRKQLRKEPVVR